MDAVRIMAKDLVRTRRYVKKFMLMRANIQVVSLKIQTLKSQNAMAQAMKGVTKAMMNMNKQMKLPEIQKIMQEFEKESDAIVTQVLDELVLQMTDQITGLPVAAGSVRCNCYTSPGRVGPTNDGPDHGTTRGRWKCCLNCQIQDSGGCSCRSRRWWSWS